jgi:hypothetical protein
MDDRIGGFGFLEKTSVDKKNEPHAFSVVTVGGNELWKYKTLLTYETNGDWLPGKSDPNWGKGITLWQKLPTGEYKRPTLLTFVTELNRQIALGEDDPAITGFKATRNARGDGDAGVSTLKLMAKSQNNVKKFLHAQPVVGRDDCIAAIDRYFEENVPKNVGEYSGIPHKPKFEPLPPFKTSAASSEETLSEDAIVMPGEDLSGSIQRMVGPHNSVSNVNRVLAERRKMRADGGRDPTPEEKQVKGKKFYDDQQWFTVLHVGWMDADGGGNSVKDVVGWYYESDCGVAEAEMYNKAGDEVGLPDDKSDDSVLSFSLVPEIEGWIARSTRFTPEQIDQQIKETEESDLGSPRVSELQKKFEELGLDRGVLGKNARGSVLKEHWLEAVRAELARRKEANTQLVVDAAWSVSALKAKAAELGLSASDLVLDSGQHAGHKRPWIVMIIRKLAEVG